jgi:TP901-1 family phage major tail protein
MAQKEIGGKLVLLKAPNGVTGAVTFTASSDKVGFTAHGLLEGDKVKFSAILLTTAVIAGTEYFVRNPGANDFEISLTKTGVIVNIDLNGTGVLDDTLQLIGGLREKSIGLTNEEIDVTNHDSDEWKTLLDEAGIRAASVSGSGVWVASDTVLKNLRSKLIQGKVVALEVILDAAGSKLAGTFKLTEFTVDGGYNAESTFSISASSSGVVAYTAGA